MIVGFFFGTLFGIWLTFTFLDRDKTDLQVEDKADRAKLDAIFKRRHP